MTQNKAEEAAEPTSAKERQENGDARSDDGKEEFEKGSPGSSKRWSSSKLDPSVPMRKLHSAERRIMFTDAAVAIAMTLLILPLMDSATEAGESEEKESVGQWYWENSRAFGSFATSFFMITRFWVAHDELYRHVEHFTTLLSFLNWFWLFLVMFTPVATSLINTAKFNSLDAFQYVVNLVLVA